MSRVKKVSDQKRPLSPGETLDKTFGCRHSNPNICKNNMTPNKCAFARDDKFCIIPPRSWKEIYKELTSV